MLILSGGQTGVDQAAVRAAQAAGLLCAGWCPPDRSCDAGTIPDWCPVQPTPYERSERRPEVPRSLRTEWNVRDSDATLILRVSSEGDDPGTDWTLEAARLYDRPTYVVVSGGETVTDVEVAKVAQWIRGRELRILHIAGPSERTAPGVGEWAYAFLLRLFRGVR